MQRIFPYIVLASLALSPCAMGADEPSVERDADNAAGATSPATQPEPLRISGLPAAEWLNRSEPVQAGNLEGRLWVVSVLEPWSTRSWQAAGMLANVAKTWEPKGVTAYIVTVESAEQVRKELPEGTLDLPIGTDSPLPLLLGLEPLPQVYLVGPEQTVVWSGPVWYLAGVLPDYYRALTEAGLSHSRTNQLTILMNRANAAAEQKEYFLSVGLASLVAQGAPPGHPLRKEAEQLLTRLDQAGSQMLAQGRQLVAHNRVTQGYDLLQEVAEQFYGLPPSSQAIQAIEQLRRNDSQWADIMRRQNESSASRTLQMAQAAMSEHHYGDAQRYYQLIIELYPRTAAAAPARQGLTQLRRDKALATQMAEQKAEPAAPVLLNLAARYVQMGRYDQARDYYQQIIQQAPGTSYAQQARQALADLPTASPASQDATGR